MEKLFNPDKVVKFFDILHRLDRTTSAYYERRACQKQVFVRRVLKDLPRCWKVIYHESIGFRIGRGILTDDIKVPIIKYIFISYIEYGMGWSDDININYFEPSSNKMGTLTIGHNDALCLEGKPISENEYNKMGAIYRVPKTSEESWSKQ